MSLAKEFHVNITELTSTALAISVSETDRKEFETDTKHFSHQTIDPHDRATLSTAGQSGTTLSRYPGRQQWNNLFALPRAVAVEQSCRATPGGSSAIILSRQLIKAPWAF